MKPIFSLIAGLGILLSSSQLQAKKVQFTVDMTGQTKSANGIHVMGDFQAVAGFGPDWTPNTCLMTQDAADTNVYHFTVSIPAFNKYEYKFLNGDQSYEVEVIPVESQVGYNFIDNRWLYVDSLNSDTLKLPAFVFGANCEQGMNMIRFKVDMTSQTSTADGIHVAGSFQGNNPATTRMYSFGNNVYEIIAYMPAGSNYTYRYYYGNTTSTGETVPAPCATGGERSLMLNIDTALETVCFSSCTTCYPSALNDTQDDTRMLVSPNPATDQFAVQFGNRAINYEVVIRDLSGRIINTYRGYGQNISVANLSLKKGIYLVEMKNMESLKQEVSKLLID